MFLAPAAHRARAHLLQPRLPGAHGGHAGDAGRLPRALLRAEIPRAGLRHHDRPVLHLHYVIAGLPQTKYLFDKALGAMLSLAVKTCVIAFLGALTSTIMLSYVQAFDAGSKESSITGDMPLLIQCLLMALLMFVLTKQIPQMVQGLLNGTPNITGASMTSIAKQGLHTGAKVGGAVASGGATLASGIARGAYEGAKKGGSIGYKAVGKGGAGVVAGAVGGVIGGALGALDRSAGMVGGAVGYGAKSLLTNKPIGEELRQGVNSGRQAFNHAPFHTQAVKSAKTVKNAIDKIIP